MSQAELGQKIRNFRKRSEMSQMDLEVAIEASPGSISRIESGKVNPSKETLVRLIDVLKLSAIEAAQLLGINNYFSLADFVSATGRINSSLELNKILQTAVDEIAHNLNLLSGFIALKRGEYIYATTSTSGVITELSLKIIPVPFNTLRVKIEPDSENLMIQSLLTKKIHTSNELADFTSPAIPKAMSKLIQRVVKMGSAISLPLVVGNETIGAMMFGKSFRDDYSGEKEILQAFADTVAIAINNSRLTKV